MLAERLAERGHDYSFKTVSSWEKGTAEPGILTFIEICRILGVTDIYEALYDENPYNPFAMLNDEGKDKLNDYASLLINSHKYDKHTAEVISIVPRRLKLYENRVSAGTGNFLDSDDYQWKEVGDDVPQDANFGLHISGDSMEPRYKDKSIVWVKQQNSLIDGNIGIFYLNGDAFCKKYHEEDGKVFLVSLNTKYAPVRVRESDSFRIFGRVLN
ncbi:MAG: LexA family transcriptional regulator, partial [Lachnospiraceae bacterium]|nr:LexA family transcriptional regulator [Lachnospiraceae bacterium]